MRKIAEKISKKVKNQQDMIKNTLRDHGQVVFLRSNNYMKISRARREMAFLDKNGKEVHVIHAFPVLKSAVPMFLKEVPRLKFKEVKPPKGWFIYSLAWQSVQAFVGVAGGVLNYYATDKPPALLKFRRSHAVRKRVVHHECFCGGDCGSWVVKPKIEYQVVLSPVPLAAVKAVKENGP